MWLFVWKVDRHSDWYVEMMKGRGSVVLGRLPMEWDLFSVAGHRADEEVNQGGGGAAIRENRSVESRSASKGQNKLMSEGNVRVLT